MNALVFIGVLVFISFFWHLFVKNFYAAFIGSVSTIFTICFAPFIFLLGHSGNTEDFIGAGILSIVISLVIGLVFKHNRIKSHVH